jgi:hypothetical protein
MIIRSRIFLVVTDIPDCAPILSLATFSDLFAIVFKAQGISAIRIVCLGNVIEDALWQPAKRKEKI